MSKKPWLKFYPSDWKGDSRLRMASLEARGLWLEMLALMHEGEPVGHLSFNGNPVTTEQLAQAAACSTDQAQACLDELEALGIFSRTRSRVIYSRRMVRDSKKAATARENGAKGGNPSLGKDSKKSRSDNPGDKGGEKAHIPEARKPESCLKDQTRPEAGPAEQNQKGLWEKGVSLLTSEGVSERNARSLIGRWVKAHGWQRVLELLDEALELEVVDARAWVTKVLASGEREPVSTEGVEQVRAKHHQQFFNKHRKPLGSMVAPSEAAAWHARGLITAECAAAYGVRIQ